MKHNSLISNTDSALFLLELASSWVDLRPLQPGQARVPPPVVGGRSAVCRALTAASCTGWSRAWSPLLVTAIIRWAVLLAETIPFGVEAEEGVTLDDEQRETMEYSSDRIFDS